MYFTATSMVGGRWLCKIIILSLEMLVQYFTQIKVGMYLVDSA